MAFVTRCPYCGAVWLLPDLDTAERGPVRCSACRNSFDATRELMRVADELFPDLPHPAVTIPTPFAPPKPAAKQTILEAPSPASVTPDPGALPSLAVAAAREHIAHNPVVSTQPDHAEIAEKPSELPTPSASEAPNSSTDSLKVSPAAAPVNKFVGETADNTDIKSNKESQQNASESKKSDDTPILSNAPAVTKAGSRAEPTLRLVPVSGKREPHLTAGSEPKLNPLAPAMHQSKTPADAGKIIPGEDAQKPVRVVMAPAEDNPARKKSVNATGLGSILLAFVLILVLCAVASIIFNQRIIQSLPQTQNFFTNLCGKIPCPGFYLANPEAFVVSKTSLRPLDESGNYALDVTIINGSNVAQAVPWLELDLLDDNDNALMTKTLSPEDYLNDPAATLSIAPNRSMTVRVSLQTNVTSARCVVKPTYPKNN